MSVSDVSAAIAPGGATGTEMRDLFRSISDGLQQQEAKIRDSFVEGLARNSTLSGVPDHVKKQFEIWDQTYTRSEDRKLVEELKARISEISLSNEAYVRDQAQQKTARFQLELAMRAANKTTSGIQQLLSAQ